MAQDMSNQPQGGRSFSLWGFMRNVLNQGMAIQMDAAVPNRYPTSKHLSARLDEAARERADELEKAMADSSLVLRVTTAYEQGFGQWDRPDVSNPYQVGQPESEAWNIGIQVSRQRHKWVSP